MMIYYKLFYYFTLSKMSLKQWMMLSSLPSFFKGSAHSLNDLTHSYQVAYVSKIQVKIKRRNAGFIFPASV